MRQNGGSTETIAREAHTYTSFRRNLTNKEALPTNLPPVSTGPSSTRSPQSSAKMLNSLWRIRRIFSRNYSVQKQVPVKWVTFGSKPLQKDELVFSTPFKDKKLKMFLVRSCAFK